MYYGSHSVSQFYTPICILRSIYVALCTFSSLFTTTVDILLTDILCLSLYLPPSFSVLLVLQISIGLANGGHYQEIRGQEERGQVFVSWLLPCQSGLPVAAFLHISHSFVRWPSLRAPVLVDSGCSLQLSLLLDLGALPFLISFPEPRPYLVNSPFLELSSSLLLSLHVVPARTQMIQ